MDISRKIKSQSNIAYLCFHLVQQFTSLGQENGGMKDLVKILYIDVTNLLTCSHSYDSLEVKGQLKLLFLLQLILAIKQQF